MQLVVGGPVQVPAEAEVVCLRTSAVEPLDERRLQRLASAVGGVVVAATPATVHPERGARSATPHDLLVREVGVTVAVDRRGQPVLEAIGAGTAPGVTGRGTRPVVAATGCLVVERGAFERAGGLRRGLGPAAALIDLALRLRAEGGVIAAVPEVVVVDHSPVASVPALRRPVAPTSTAWRDVVALHGPALRRTAFEAAPAPRVALTTAAPPGLVARRWGDWELAAALGRALERAGVEARVQTLDQADTVASRTSDVQLVVRGLTPVRRTSGQGHVLWVISHPDALSDAELDEADLVLAASARLAERLRPRTATPVDVLLQATDHHRFRPTTPRRAHQHDITVVANTRGVFRPAVAHALAAGLRPALYGEGWTDLVERSMVVRRNVPNGLLPVVYSSAGVVLNDHWPDMRDLGMVANRVYDVLACATPLVSDPVPGLEELLGDVVDTFTSPEQLRDAVSSVLGDRRRARHRAEQGRALVLAHHTFDRRARQLSDLLREHDLLPGSPAAP